MPRERSFQYTRRTADDVKARANARGGGFDDFIKSQYKKYKVRDGKNLIRILPPTWEDAGHYGYDVYVNYSVGADNGAYLSLSKMKKVADPLAEARRMALREDNEKLARDLEPRQRILMWVIDRQDEDEGPQLWPAPFTFDRDLANISMDEDTREVIFIDDPETGCDVSFFKEGTGLKTRYEASKMRLKKPSPIHEDQKLQDQWLEYISGNPIPTCLQWYDYEHINAVFNGASQASKKEDSEEETRTTRPSARTRPSVSEGEENPLPLKRTTSPQSHEDDDEDAYETPPVRKKTGGVVEDNDDKRVAESIRDRLRKASGRSAPQPDEDD